MNAAHLHLIVNHLSIVGLGFAILINILAIIRKKPGIEKLACWFYILIAVLSVLPILTGDSAAEIVNTYPGISSDAIEYHETWGYVFFYALSAIGVLSIIALWLSGKNPMILRKFNIAFVVLAFIALFLAFQAGSTGGKIRHPEVENGAFRK